MVKGSCVCGSLQYDFTGEPAMYGACHCIPCRKTGGADRSLNLIMPNDTIKVTSGKLKDDVVRKGDSGKNVTYHMCDKCNNIIYVRAEAMDGMTILKMGTVDDEDFLNKVGPPKVELYCVNRWQWEQPIASAEQKDRM